MEIVSIRQRDLSGKAQAVDGTRKVPRDEISRAIPAPEANAELETSLDYDIQRWRVVTQAIGKRKSEKISPPHQDAAVGNPLDESHNGQISFGVAGSSFRLSIFNQMS
ncbi:hypothetical protein POM88_038870 [Heracleum sosnowskyi]|uniref:Uncharacterized protein n=1 Tax=Heracleum sosnowskyi TaxID=360622 RepID=A0AAD8HA66_9APIA|nr:hypothetical protein POM88_038870 [Heracleum sosnowskyi]